MQLSDYTYELPNGLIADVPPKVRGTSRLMVVHKQSGQLDDRKYRDATDYLSSGDVLVLNDTRVIKARLEAVKANGAARELIVLEKHGHDADWHLHRVMHRGRLSDGDKLRVGEADITVVKVLGDGIAEVKSSRDLLELTEQYGAVPLPPYMHRNATPLDVERYQTVWAKEKGSVAAPTASLNMTDEILEALRAKGVQIVYLTLHVGLGTFMPIRTDKIEEHHMHQEYFEIPASTIAAIQAAKAAGKRVVALGTTVTRTLEYAHQAVLHEAPRDLSGEADIFIYPGYTFQAIDGLLTNYHAPKSTVLMLTAAFAGWDTLKKAYEHAVAEQYHFLSYGDSMLILA
ncbi:MAG TPA: tRNA preQ1(34) S-adenosylmethionine ribosyltransferase-isomerase QueA [Candidatus Saccharimonadales bacterium]|nr:tRNA preQ1(34) S-adenosylmethionine ribosyltransferase-isomerase QueA [Candidatus Saccharimonadales bacterium]